MKVCALLILANVLLVLSLIERSESFILMSWLQKWFKNRDNHLGYEVIFCDRNCAPPKGCDTNKNIICANQDCRKNNGHSTSRVATKKIEIEAPTFPPTTSTTISTTTLTSTTARPDDDLDNEGSGSSPIKRSRRLAPGDLDSEF